MLDFKDFAQLAGIMQMKDSDEETLKHIKEMYDQYLNSDKEVRDNIEGVFVENCKPIIKRLHNLLECD